jgi:hypothetical protein
MRHFCLIVAIAATVTGCLNSPTVVSTQQVGDPFVVTAADPHLTMLNGERIPVDLGTAKSVKFVHTVIKMSDGEELEAVDEVP